MTACRLPVPPSPLTPEIDRFTGAFVNRLEDHPADFRRRRIPAVQSPAGDTRAWLEKRRAEQQASLIPTPGPELNRMLTLLLAPRQYGTLTEKAAGLWLALYLEALGDLPTWAVEQARMASGNPGWRCLWDGRDVPSSHDVVAECRHILLPIEIELRRLDVVLDTDLYDNGATDGHRANAVAHWALVKAEMRDDDADVFASTEESFRQRAHSWLKPTSVSVPVSGPTRRRMAEER
ncbi:hypothetical protein [Methylobacterium sp. J-092]|uniref:hypothetical protein n=1 Tax=Methylobacterium sp. J-092 TaxID=2836667 RepID=UPI001FB94B1B|nr:hypothetical protein [Methylobacterium sp. J-092]MCJ2009145.1 hypothetical protein [Methylobacterium sp. J-092]